METNTKTRVDAVEAVDTTAQEIDKIIIISVACFAGVIGLWSVACLISAMIASGGPFALAGAWFMAISGL